MNPIAVKISAFTSTSARTIFACMVVTLALTICCQASVAQDKSKSQSKVESYLHKKDANRNGRIEPEEMSQSTKNYLMKMGYDVNKTVTISKVVAKADKAERERGREQSRTKADLKVPGFGVDTDSGTGVKSFNTSAETSGKTVAKKTYSANVREQTEQTLERYDRNKDGVMDSSEIERARWGSPKPSISDLNRDGKLSRNELNERYAAREKSKTSSSSSKYSSSRKEDERSRSSTSRSRPTSSASRPDSSSRSTTSESSSSKPKEIDRGKYLKYAQSLVKNYDKDEDGKLSQSELKKMRRPPVGADANDDGFVSETELVDSLSGANKDKTASKDKDAKSSSSETRKSSYRSRSTSSGSRSRTSSSLEKLDANGDNQVQMHEFADDWDDDVVAEFYEKDKNSDGVITAAEWSSRN